MKGFKIAFITFIVACTALTVASDDSNVNSALIPCPKKPVPPLLSDDLSYDWIHAGSGIPVFKHPDTKDRVSLTANGALLINNFGLQDHGFYVCRATKDDSVITEAPVKVNDTFRLPIENCHSAACIEASKCNSPRTTNSCPTAGEVCCTQVREEDKHFCRHFGGECMTRCSTRLQVTRADDCSEGTKCCVLVN